MGILAATLKVLKFPLKLLSRLVGNKSKKPKRTEREQKQINHVRNFDPTRLNNRSWQIRSGKSKKPKKRNKKTKKLIKSVNKNYETKQSKKTF